MLTVNKEFYLFLSNLNAFIYFPSLIALLEPLIQYWIEIVTVDIFVLLLFEEDSSWSFTIKHNVCCRLFVVALPYVEEGPIIPSSENFY